MKCFCSSSSKSFDKLVLPKTNYQSHQSNTYSFLKLKSKEINTKKSENRFYYKNPQFLNDSNIKKQISILLTNVNNSKSTKKLPKLIFDESNNINDLDKVKMNYYIKTSENELPKIKSSRRNIFDNSKTNNNLNKSFDYEYKSIFPNDALFRKKNKKYINNKLNIIYCQNEEQYKFIMEKRNRIKESSKKIEEESEKINKRMNNIKTKVKFMKNVIDYSYPSFLLAKIQIWNKNKYVFKTGEKLLPREEQKCQQKNKNIIMTNYLKKNFKVYPLKVE